MKKHFITPDKTILPSCLTRSAILVSINFLFLANIEAQIISDPGYKDIRLDTSYQHTKWGITPGDVVYHFAAYTTSFDSDDDNNGDNNGDIWGIPEWVAYEVKAETGPEPPSYTRPKWMTSDSLHQLGQAPNDDTYSVSGTTSLREVSTSARFVRGHMCPKDVADRISEDAGYNTHTILNAVPQLQWQNNGIWKSLENQVTDWADKYGRVWVICGPVFFRKTPALWLGQDGEVRAAVPDALYKIVIRQTNGEIESLAFIIPNIILTKEKKFQDFLTSIARIEDLTGISFLTAVDEVNQTNEKIKNLNLSDSQKRKIVNKW